VDPAVEAEGEIGVSEAEPVMKCADLSCECCKFPDGKSKTQLPVV
jgi:hypothetical protein